VAAQHLPAGSLAPNTGCGAAWLRLTQRAAAAVARRLSMPLSGIASASVTPAKARAGRSLRPAVLGTRLALLPARSLAMRDVLCTEHVCSPTAVPVLPLPCLRVCSAPLRAQHVLLAPGHATAAAAVS